MSPPHRSAKNVWTSKCSQSVWCTPFDPPRNFSLCLKTVPTHRERLAVLSPAGPTKNDAGHARAKKVIRRRKRSGTRFSTFFYFEIFVEIGVFTIFGGPQHFSFSFPQRTWMGKVLGDSLPQLSIRVGSIWDNRATLVLAPENARK